MIEPTATEPSRALKTTSAVARWLWWLSLGAWLGFFALWGVLHGWIVPRIEDFRPRIEAAASRALGVPLRIGAISARSDGLVPSFTLENVELLDAAGQPALRLKQVVAALSPRSVAKLGFEQLYIDAPDLDVRRAADGTLFVAGVAVGRQADGGRGADWVFSQTEIVVRQGTLRWTDEQRGAAPLALSQVDLVLRNHAWRHELRLDATPPAGQGERFTLVGRFRQPLLSVHNGRWQEWSGQAYGYFPGIELAPWAPQVMALLPELESAAGRGAVRGWADVGRGALTGGVLDLALRDAAARFKAVPTPLALQELRGRFSGHRSDTGFDLATQGLDFLAADGLRWPGGNGAVRYTHATPRQAAQGELKAERVDLGTLARLAQGLPLGEEVRSQLARHDPRGQVDRLQASWEGELSAPTRYLLRGHASGLAWNAQQPTAAAQAAAEAAAAALRRADPQGQHPVHPALGSPGARGLTADFDLTQAGGTAQLAIDRGALEFPGVFEEPVVPLDALRGELRWQRAADGRLSLQVPRLAFANADMAGEARATWHTGEGAARFPGVLDLSGSLSRGDGTKVHRYLPQGIPADVRHYVRDGITAGVVASAQFKVSGDLRHVPAPPKQGEFHIAAQVRDVTYQYAPPSTQPPGRPPWPALARLSGELVFDHNSMDIRNATGRLVGPNGKPGEVLVTKAQASIPDLARTVVAVQADAQGPLAEMLAIVNGSPLAALTSEALARASASGVAGLRLGLELPIARIHDTKVKGVLALSGNDLRFSPDTPQLGRVRGSVAFTETGLTVANAQARLLGGDARIDGTLRSSPAANGGTTEHVLAFKAQGTATAEGLRQAREIGLPARLAERATGQAAYTAALTLRGAHPELSINSSLQGLALNLPAPLGKSAEASLPLRYESTVQYGASGTGGAGAQEQIALDLGSDLRARYQLDLAGATPRVLRGSIAVGLQAGEAVALPDRGVAANIRVAQLDADAWEKAVEGLSSTPQAAAAPAAAPADAGARPRPAAPVPATALGSAAAEAEQWLPDTLAVRVGTLTADGRTLRNLVAGGSRKGDTWSGNLDADELSGYVEYHEAAGTAPPRIYARLARLRVPESATREVENLLEKRPPAAADTGAGQLPALDIEVADFELKGRKLGRLQVNAVNRAVAQGREWRLNRLALTLPEASFDATGNWAAAAGQAARHTSMDFKLDIHDAGALLSRFGMAGVVRRGEGQLAGSVGWKGSPFTPDYGSMDGSLHLDVTSGQFLKADPGLAKLLGVLSLQALPRRLTLDFRDVFSEGFAFDFVRGDVKIDDGTARTNNLQMKGVNAAVLMEGQADIKRETQNLRAVVVPEINAGTASLVAAVINPAIGLGTFLAQVFLRGPLAQATTQEFHISGSWSDPKIEKLTGRDRLGATPPPAAGGTAP